MHSNILITNNANEQSQQYNNDTTKTTATTHKQ